MNHGLGADAIRHHLPAIPQSNGIYKMIDAAGNIIYIGKANNLRSRVSSYTKLPAPSPRTEIMVAQVAKVEIIITTSEDEALLLEARMVRSLQPKYNVLLKDDKSYPFLSIDMSVQYPRIFAARLTEKRCALAGPFASTYEANQTLSVVQKIYKVRSCTNTFFKARTRPCIEYQIGRCSAPCVGKITTDDYASSIKQAVAILSGETRDVINELYALMQKSSAEENYEKAVVIRDRIFALEKLSCVNKINVNISGDYIGLFRENDVCCAQIFRVKGGNLFGNISYFIENIQDQTYGEILSTVITRHYLIKEIQPLDLIVTRVAVADKPILERSMMSRYGIKTRITLADNISKKVHDENEAEAVPEFLSIIEKNAEMELRTKLKLKEDAKEIFKEIGIIFNITKSIETIEVFDNSHTSGGSPLGAIIVANKDGFVKSQYRIFNMDDIDLSDDYAMMRSALIRRLTNNTRAQPSLLIIDGGKGHLNAALGVLQELTMDIPCISISKGKERRASKEKFHIKGKRAFSLRENERVFRYMQRLRDEAHRFAISSHIRRRNKRSLQITK